MQVDIRKVGTLEVPEIIEKYVDIDDSFLVLKAKDLDGLDKIFKEIKSGKKVVVLKSDEKRVKKIFSYLEKKADEILNSEFKDKRTTKRDFDKKRDIILNSIFLIAEGDSVISLKGEDVVTYMFGLCGGDLSKRFGDDLKYLIPYKFYCDLKEKLKEEYFIQSIDKRINAGPNVLLPKSNDTIDLFNESLLKLKDRYESPAVLDMGCGSGVLTILASHIFDSLKISFTDIIQEAISTAVYNISKLHNREFNYNEGSITLNLEAIEFKAEKGGNLFDNIDDKFDIIMFNAPWIVAKARNRSELALNDEGQKTITNFLEGCKTNLNKDGRIILGYSDNSGDEAVENLNDIISNAGFVVEDSFVKRIQSYQSGRKWMKIFTYNIKFK